MSTEKSARSSTGVICMTINGNDHDSIQSAVHAIMQAQVHSHLDNIPDSELNDEEFLTRSMHHLALKAASSSGCLESEQDPWAVRKYGCDFKNTVFEMHPFWWDGCSCHVHKMEEEFAAAHPHAETCFYTRNIEHMVFEEVLGYCDCHFAKQYYAWLDKTNLEHSPDCRLILPNFRCGDIDMHWYKHIGRDMACSREITRQELEQMFQRCFDSLRT